MKELDKQARTHILEHLAAFRRAMVVPLERDERRLAKQTAAAYAEGALAFRVGCAESATPYSWRCAGELRRAWRDGWLEERRARR